MNKMSVLILFLVTALLMINMMPMEAFANDTKDENYLTNGIVKGIKSFSVGIAIALPLAAALAIGYQQLMKMFDEDDMTAVRNKKTRSILKAAVLGETASVFVALVTSFFQ